MANPFARFVEAEQENPFARFVSPPEPGSPGPVAPAPPPMGLAMVPALPSLDGISPAPVARPGVGESIAAALGGGLPMMPALPSLDGIPPVPTPRPGVAALPAPEAPASPPDGMGLTPLALGIVESLFGGGEPLPPDPSTSRGDIEAGFGTLALAPRGMWAGLEINRLGNLDDERRKLLEFKADPEGVMRAAGVPDFLIRQQIQARLPKIDQQIAEIEAQIAALTPEVGQTQLDLAQRQAAINAVPMNPQAQAVGEAETFPEGLRAFGRDPLGVARTFVLRSLPASLPGIGGAIVGSLAGPGGAAFGAGVGEGGIELGVSIADGILTQLAENGIDTSDPDAIAAFAAQNPDGYAQILNDALTRAGIIGTVGAATGAGSAAMAQRAVGAPLRRQVATAGAGGVLETVGEGAGEAGAGLATTGEVNPGEVLAEVFGAGGQGTVTTAGQIAAQTAAGGPATQRARVVRDLLERTEAPPTARALRGGDASLTLTTPEPPAQPPAPTALSAPPVVAALPPPEEPEENLFTQEPEPGPDIANVFATPPEEPEGESTPVNVKKGPEFVKKGPEFVKTPATPPEEPVDSASQDTSNAKDVSRIPAPDPALRPVETVAIPEGGDVEFQFTVVEADDLLTSDQEGFPAELQPRDRSRAASETQIESIANKLNPARLFESPETDRGAPVVGSDGVVESGNGRVIAIRRAIERGKADAYRAFVNEHFPEAANLTNPVIVRRRVDSGTETDRRAFTRASNVSATLAQSATEKARTDADLIDLGILEKMTAVAINAPGNRDAIRNFFAKLPASERGALLTSGGGLSVEGQRRFQNALFFKAFGNERLLSKLTESADQDDVGVTNAFVETAPAFARLRERIRTGQVAENTDPTQGIQEALDAFASIRNDKGTLADFRAQGEGFFDGGLSPAADVVLEGLFGKDGKRPASKKAVTDFLREYVRLADQQRVDQESLGGDLTVGEPQDAAQIAKRALETTRKKPDDQQTLLERAPAQPDSPGRGAQRQAQSRVLDADDVRARPPARSESDVADASEPKQPNIRTFGNAAEVNRASRFDDAWIAAGIDPEEAALMPVERQFKILSDTIRNQFGMAGVEKTPRLQSILGVEQLKDAFRNLQFMAHALGLPATGIGLGNKLGLTLRKNVGRYLGAYARNGRGAFEGAAPTTGPNIIIPGRSVSFAHEWGHALDAHLISKLHSDKGAFMSGFLRQFERRTRKADPTDVEAWGDISFAFADVMRALLFKGHAPGQEASTFLEQVKTYDPGNKYWATAHEMFARSFEAYVANRVEMAGGGREFITKGDVAYEFGADERLEKTFPKGVDRLRIFATMDRLMKALAESEELGTGVAAKPGEPVYSPSQWRKAYGDRQGNALKRFFRREIEGLADIRRQLTAAFQLRNSTSLREGLRSLSQQFNAWLSSITGTMLSIQKRRNSKAVDELIDLIAARPGSGRAVTNPYEFEVTGRFRTFNNRLTKITKAHRITKMTLEQQDLLTQILVTGGSVENLPAEFDSAPKELRAAATELRALMNDVWFYIREAGLDIGFTKNGFLPRLLNQNAIDADVAGFEEAAALTFGDKFDGLFPDAEAVAESPQDFIDLAARLAKQDYLDAAVVKRLKAAVKADEGLAEAIEAEMDAVRAAYTEERPQAWLSQIWSVDGMDIDRQQVGDGFTKSRTLPASADKHLAKFYGRNPVDRIQSYLMSATRRAEYVRNFGLNGEKIKALLNQARDEGVTSEELDYIQKGVDIATGRKKNRWLTRGQARAVDTFHAIGMMTLLPRVLWTNIQEPMNAAVRTGSFRDSLRIPIRMIREGTSLIVQDTSVENMRDLGDAFGIISDSASDTLFNNRFLEGAEPAERLSRVTANFFRNSGLHGYTNASRRVAMDIAFWDLRRLSRKVLGSKTPGFAIARLADYGVPKNQQKAFAEWFIDITEKGVPDYQTIEQDEFAPVLGRALRRGAFESIQETKKVDRTVLANDPVGKVVWGLTSFIMSFQRNIIFRSFKHAKLVATGETEAGDRVSRLEVAEHVALGLVPAIASSVGMAMLVSLLRAQIFGDDDDFDRLTDEGILDKDLLLLGLLRSGFAGRLDPWVNYGANGLKYDASTVNLMVGPYIGYNAQQIDKITKVFGPRNSPDNNKAEFRAAQGMYQLFAVPLQAYLVSAIPAGPALGAALGTGLQFTTTTKARDAAVEAIMGPKDGSRRRRQ